MLHILVNAYAVSPTWGSEPGMGWNWVINLAQYCRVTVITEGEWRREIEAALAELPQRANLRFIYNPASPRVRRMCWNQGDWRFYWHYRRWQRRTLRLARQIVASEHVDAIHQLNMIGFREPGYLWKIKNVPFVWGPVGGMELVPTGYLKGDRLRRRLAYKLKNTLNELQYRHHPRVRAAIRRADVVLAAVKGVQDVLRDVYHKPSLLINETGTTVDAPIAHTGHADSEFRIVWVGRFLPSKLLGLALRAITHTKAPRIKFHIYGTGDDRTVAEMRLLATRLGIDEQCVWHGKVAHEHILTMMAQSDLMLFTSVMEATSTVVLEAITAGLPVLSFYTCGFGPLVRAFAGVAIDLTTPEESVAEFAAQINYLAAHPTVLSQISQAEIQNRSTLSWDSKARRMVEIYNDIVNKYSQTHHYED